MLALHLRRVVALLSWAIAVPALAQSGRIAGTVRGADNVPIIGAHVLIPTVGLSAVTGEGGRFTLTGIPHGSYDLRVFSLGYGPVTRPGVIVDGTTSGTTSGTSLNIVLERAAFRLPTIVQTASRHTERITDAAASVTVVDAAALDARIGNSYAIALRNAPGLDVTQVGITSVFVNGRGFNNRFNTRWLTLEDGRVAVLAETGLPIGEHTTIPKLDVAAMEIVSGPGSALYGANASSGLVALRTKDPREYPGLSTEVSGGSRNLYDIQARYAATRGSWGFKIVGEDQAANDFTNLISYPAITVGGPALPETIANFRTRVSRASGALVRYFDGGAQLQLNVGTSRRDGLGDSNSGHYQIINYRYSNYQLVYSSARWVAQSFVSLSNSGDTYQLYAAVPTAARNPALSADSIRALTHFRVDGRVYAAEIQNNFLVSMLARTGIRAVDNSLVTWGAQLRRHRVSSYNKLFSDVLTKRPIVLDNNGVYVQMESPLATGLRAVVSARYDLATRYASQLSPRASLLVTPWRDHTFRVTYGEAYRAPPILSTDAYNAVSPTQRNVGNARGFIVTDTLGNVVRTVARMVPEINRTWELGYKAEIASRLFVDVTLWHSVFAHFISGGLLVANPFAAGARTWAYDAGTGERFNDAAGNPVRVQSNFNVGEGIANGIDAAWRFYITERFAISSVMSLTRLDTIKTKPTDPKDAGQFNTSSNRMSLTFETTDLPDRVNTFLTLRYVNGYMFRSGAIWGRVPSFGSLDVAASYRVPSQGMTVTLQAQNIAGCVGGTSTLPATGISTTSMATYTKAPRCAFGQKHAELLSMPALGPMIFLGIRKEWW